MVETDQEPTMGLEHPRPNVEITSLSRWSEMCVFDDVDSYDGKKQILHGINLYADKGQSGLVGATGAGKTTITNSDQPLL